MKLWSDGPVASWGTLWQCQFKNRVKLHASRRDLGIFATDPARVHVPHGTVSDRSRTVQRLPSYQTFPVQSSKVLAYLRPQC